MPRNGGSSFIYLASFLYKRRALASMAGSGGGGADSSLSLSDGGLICASVCFFPTPLIAAF